MSKAPKITVYSTPTCGFCRMAKAYFAAKGLEYDEIDVSQNQAAQAEMIEKSGQVGVPVIEIDDKIIVGFNRPQIDLLI